MTEISALLRRYGWEDDGATTFQNRWIPNLTPVRHQRSIAKGNGTYTAMGDNPRWSLPGTDYCCSIGPSAIRLYRITTTPPSFIDNIPLNDLDRLEDHLIQISRSTNTPIVSTDEWEELMEMIGQHAEDIDSAMKIIDLLKQRNWSEFWVRFKHRQSSSS